MLNQQRGIALVEVLIAAVIVAIGLSGMGALLLAAIQSTRDSSQTSQGMWIVQDYVGRIRANSLAAMNGHYALTTGISCSSLPDPMCATHSNSEGERVVPADCSARQMAQFDQWNVICGTDSSALDSAGEFLRSPVLGSVCSATDATTGFCTQYTVSLSWSTSHKNTQTSQFSMIVEVE